MIELRIYAGTMRNAAKIARSQAQYFDAMATIAEASAALVAALLVPPASHDRDDNVVDLHSKAQ